MLFLSKFLTWLASPLVVALVLGWLAWWAAFQKQAKRLQAELVAGYLESRKQDSRSPFIPCVPDS